MNCKVDNHQSQDVLTVGREFYLRCEGEWSVAKQVNTDKLTIQLPPPQKYALKLLKFEFRDSTTADLLVTSYQVGDVNIPQVTLTDGEQTWELGPVQFHLDSVIREPTAEPYGPLGPMEIPIPMTYWMILFFVILGSAMVLGYKFYRYNQRKKMIDNLKEHDSAMSPLQEFHFKVRQLQRCSPVFYQKDVPKEEIVKSFNELNQMWKMFLVRELRIPAFEWNHRMIMADIRRYHKKINKDLQTEITLLMNEMDRAKAAEIKLDAQDIIELLKRTRFLVEQMTARNQGGGA